MDGLTYFTGNNVNMPPGSSVVLEKAEQWEYVSPPSHDFIEVVFVAKGSALHRHVDLNGRIFVMPEFLAGRPELREVPGLWSTSSRKTGYPDYGTR